MEKNIFNIPKNIMVEWEIILECNFKCFYCSNGRNDCLKRPIPFVNDVNKISTFIDLLHDRFSDVEWFIFGGEPFMHPKIDFIINKLNHLNQPFMVQTNFSLYKKIERLKKLDFILQVSLHREQIVNFDEYFKYLILLNNKIRRIDIMYEDEADEKIFDRINPFFKNKVFLTPVAGFKDNNPRSNNALYNFNKLKNIKPGKCEPGPRSFIWEKMFRGHYTTRGKPCIYKNIYHLFDPQFNEYNCSHRINCDICPNEHCFLQSI